MASMSPARADRTDQPHGRDDAFAVDHDGEALWTPLRVGQQDAYVGPALLAVAGLVEGDDLVAVSWPPAAQHEPSSERRHAASLALDRRAVRGITASAGRPGRPPRAAPAAWPRPRRPRPRRSRPRWRTRNRSPPSPGRDRPRPPPPARCARPRPRDARRSWWSCRSRRLRRSSRWGAAAGPTRGTRVRAGGWPSRGPAR